MVSTAATETRTWALEIPAPAKMHSENHHVHWGITSKAAKAWRKASFVAAIEAGLPQHLGRVRIDVSLHFGDNRDRDAYNYHKYVVKPLVDGLAKPRTVNGKRGPRDEPGYQLVDDDNPRYVDGPFITIGAKVPRKDLPNGLAVITITDLGEATLPAAAGAVPAKVRPARQCECGTTYYGSSDMCTSCRRREAIVSELLDEDGAAEAAARLRRDRSAVFTFVATSMMGTNRSPTIAAVTEHINRFRGDDPISEHRVRAVVDTLTADGYLSYTNRKFKILKALGGT